VTQVIGSLISVGTGIPSEILTRQLDDGAGDWAPLHDVEHSLPVSSREAPPLPSHTARLTYLDGWRGVSLSLVLIGHFFNYDPIAVIGVQMFFALSGRLMADILFVENYPIGKFYKRRFSRIYPALLVFIPATYVLVHSTSLSFKPAAGFLGLIFLLNYAMIIGHGVAAIENLWSLCVEEHSYLILGFLAFYIRRKARNPKPLLLAVAILSLCDGLLSAFAFHEHGRAIFWRTDTQLAPIFLAAGFYLHMRQRKVASWLPLMALAAGIGAGIADPLLGYSVGTFCFSFVIAKLDDAPRIALSIFGSRLWVSLGLWSYSIYLWQQPFFRYAFEGKINSLVAFGLAIGAGLVSFYLVERPARRWLNSLQSS
jgi:peptidoglycan/LPS O-acetylase OafA/YrhL